MTSSSGGARLELLDVRRGEARTSKGGWSGSCGSDVVMDGPGSVARTVSWAGNEKALGEVGAVTAARVMGGGR